MRRRFRGRRYAPPPPPPEGQIWDLDEYVSHADYAEPHVQEMRAFDALPPMIRRELRRTGQSALEYLKFKRREAARMAGWERL